MTQTPQDRRFEPRHPANTRGVVVAPGLEMACLVVDRSASGLRLRLDRNLALPDRIVVVDIAQALAMEGAVAWRKGQDAGLKGVVSTPLRGLVPARLTQARDAWIRAGGR